jgi:hypothetical protein
MHLDGFTKHLESDPELRRVLTEKIVNAYQAFERAQAAGVDPSVIRNIVERSSGRILSLFQWDDPIYDITAPYLERLLPAGLSIDTNILNEVILADVPDFDTEVPFAEAWGQVMSRIDELPTATRALFHGLEDMGVIDARINGGQISGWSRIRWSAVNAPADPELRGHMEKVHGVEGIHYGPEEVVPPLEVVHRQHAAIDEDAGIYDERKQLLNERQGVMVGIFDWLTRDRSPGTARTDAELALDKLFVAVLDHDTATIQQMLSDIPEQLAVTQAEIDLFNRCSEYLTTLSGYENRHQVSIAEERDKILARKSTNPE